MILQNRAIPLSITYKLPIVSTCNDVTRTDRFAPIAVVTFLRYPYFSWILSELSEIFRFVYFLQITCIFIFKISICFLMLLEIDGILFNNPNESCSKSDTSDPWQWWKQLLCVLYQTRWRFLILGILFILVARFFQSLCFSFLCFVLQYFFSGILSFCCKDTYTEYCSTGLYT